MSDKSKDFDEEIVTPDTEDNTQNAEDTSSDQPQFEQSDDWTFEAEAPMLNQNIVGDEFEIDIPSADESVSKPADKPAPKAVKPVQQDSPVSKNDKVMFTLTALIIVVLVALLAFLGVRYYTVPNSDEKMNPGNVAVTVDGVDVSVGLYNYYYSMVFNEYTSGQYEIDPYSDFSAQITTDEDGNKITWLEMFEKTTVDRIQSDLAAYKQAVDAGVELTDQQNEDINGAIDSLKETASQSDMTIDQYLAQNYGDHCGQATIRKLLVQYYTAQNYSQQKSVTYKLTDDEKTEYREAHKDDYQKVKIAYLPVTYQMGDEEAAEKSLKQAKKYAKDIKTEDDMKLLIPKVWKSMIDQYVEAGYYESKDACILDIAENMEADISKNMEGFVDEALDWLFDENTKVNDVATFSSPDEGVVYIFMKLSDPDYDRSEVYSVRHILIQPETDEVESEDGKEAEAAEPTKEQWNDAKKKAEKVLKEYTDGEMTEVRFAELAEEYSSDTGSISAGMQSYGGIYSGVPLGQMVKEFESWATDKSRKYGDVDIVKTDYGYHIMFFIEDTESYLFNLDSAALAEKQEKELTDSKVKVHKLAMKNTKVAEPMEKQDASQEGVEQDLE